MLQSLGKERKKNFRKLKDSSKCDKCGKRKKIQRKLRKKKYEAKKKADRQNGSIEMR